MKKAAEELQHTRQRPVILIPPVARSSERNNEETAPDWVPVSARGALAVSKEERGPSLILELRNVANANGRMEFDVMVKLKKRLQQK